MARPHFEPQSVAPILQEGLRSRLPYLSQPTGADVAGIPALGKMADAAFAADKKRSVVSQQAAYAQYLAKIDAGTATEDDHKTGMIAGLSLGLNPPDLLTKRLQRSQIDENEASASLKTATAGLYNRGGSPDDGSGPEIVTKDGRQFIKRKDMKGMVTYTPLQPGQDDKPISAETAKTANLASAGLRAISQIRTIMADPANKSKFLTPNMIAGGFGGKAFAAMSGDTNSQILAQQIGEAGDAISRLRSGAAITADEEARYGGLLQGRFKTPEAYANALRTVETFLQGVQNDLNVGRRKLNAAQPALGAPPPQAAAGGGSDDLLNRHGLP
jgi:hypothetical protein